MRRLIVQEWISLDGYATDKDDKLDFFAPTVRDIYTDEYYKNYLEGIDCILFGRKTYQQFASLWPDRPSDLLADKINTIQKIVVSNSLVNAPWGKWHPVRVVAGDVTEAIKILKQSEGKNIVIWGSLSIAQVLIQARLVDEYHLHVCPTINGGGRKLLADGSNALALSLIRAKQLENGIVSLHYHSKN